MKLPAGRVTPHSGEVGLDPNVDQSNADRKSQSRPPAWLAWEASY